MLYLKIIRKKESYDYKLLKNLNNFSNNIKNNCIDSIILYKDGVEIYRNDKIQTVANYPQSHFKDTIKEGKFQIKCFVDAGYSFADPNNLERIKIHGIINAIDQDGQSVNSESKQIDKGIPKGRWLIHSTFSPKIGYDLNHAYSQGCFIFLHTKDLDDFNNVLILNGIKKRDTIDGELLEV